MVFTNYKFNALVLIAKEVAMEHKSTVEDLMQVDLTGNISSENSVDLESAEPPAKRRKIDISLENKEVEDDVDFQIVNAAFNGDFKRLKQFVRDGKDIVAYSRFGIPLCEALWGFYTCLDSEDMRHKLIKTIRLLLKSGASMQYDDYKHEGFKYKEKDKRTTDYDNKYRRLEVVEYNSYPFRNMAIEKFKVRYINYFEFSDFCKHKTAMEYLESLSLIYHMEHSYIVDDTAKEEELFRLIYNYTTYHKCKDYAEICSSYENNFVADLKRISESYIAKGVYPEQVIKLDTQVQKLQLRLQQEKELSASDVYVFYTLECLFKKKIADISEFLKDRKAEVKNRLVVHETYSYIDQPRPGFYLLPEGSDLKQKLFRLLSTFCYQDIGNRQNDNEYKANLALIKKLDPNQDRMDSVLRMVTDTANYRIEMPTELKKALSHKEFIIEKLRLVLECQEILDDYDSEYLSEDSDNDEELRFQDPQSTSTQQKAMLKNQALRFIDRAGASELIATKTNKRKTMVKDGLKLVDGLENKPSFTDVFKPETTQGFITLPSILDKTNKIEQDLRRLNHLWVNGLLNEETIKQIDTHFVVANFRGITYDMAQWSQKQRREHRKANELYRPLYSLSIFNESNVTFSSLIKAREEENDELEKQLLELAVNLRDQLINLRASGDVMTHLHESAKAKTMNYANFAHAVQDAYSKDINGFYRNIKQKKADIKQQGVRVFQDLVFTSFLNELNAFVSTADTPQHALHYAYGGKFYEGHKHKRLRPCYKSSGRPDRLAVGKVYVIMHKPLDFLTDRGPMHVPSLNESGLTAIDERIVAELETTFPGFVEENKVVAQHVAKFPSFENEDYKEIYLYKYGLTEKLYHLFRKNIKDTKPHTKERKRVINLLTTYLCAYHGINLIEQAYTYAREKNQVLVYRDEFGNFSFLAAQIRFENKKEAGKQVFNMRNEKKLSRQTRISTTNFFTELLQDKKLVIEPYKVCPVMRVLLRATKEYDIGEITTKNIKDKIQVFTENDKLKIAEYASCYPGYEFKDKFESYIKKLYAGACLLNLYITLYNFQFEKSCISIQPADCSEENLRSIEVYFGGGQSFALIIENDHSQLRL